MVSLLRQTRSALSASYVLERDGAPVCTAELPFRLLNPTAWIRMAAGRGRFAGGGRALFQAGANAAITGDMLTTTGTGIAGDRAMLTELGFVLETTSITARRQL